MVLNHQDLDPSSLIQNLPGYDQGAFEVEYYDVMEDIAANGTFSEDPDADAYAAFKRFHKEIFNRRAAGQEQTNADGTVNKARPGQADFSDDIFPYRYGSYLIYQADNYTKQFRIANFINLTS